MALNDRTHRKVITHRIAAGRPGNPSGYGRDRAPKRLDYLEITTSEADPKTGQFPLDMEAMRRLVAMGERYAVEVDGVIKARRVPIRVYADDLDEVLQQDYCSRTSLPKYNADGTPKMVLKQEKDEREAKLVHQHALQPWCKGDGLRAKRMQRGGDHVEIPCRASPRNGDRPIQELEKLLTRQVKHDPTVDLKRCPWAQNASLAAQRDAPQWSKDAPVCKPETVLVCHCDVASSLGSYARFRSHGHFTADEMASSLADIKAQIGFLAGVPLDLVLVMKQISVPGMARRTLQPVVHVELRLSPEETVQLMEKQAHARLAYIEHRKMLQAARKEADEEVVDGEFVHITGRDGGGGLKVE